MRKLSTFGRSVCLAALLAVTATPALAEGKGDRAKKAIAEAQGRVDASAQAGSGGDAPRLQAEAQAALRTAREDFDAGHKESAIAAANHASGLADQAIAVANKNRAEDQAAVQADAAATAVAAQQQTAQAQQDAAAARDAAAAANNRASNAEQSAALANAQAEALRNTPPATTTVTTTDTTNRVASSASSAPKKVVRRTTTTRPVRSATEQRSTTTTVTTQPATGG